MANDQEVAAKTGMLIRKPVTKVFEAFIDPEITTNFWFTKSTGKLETGKCLEWTWEMYNITIPVEVKAIALNKKIVIEWGNYSSNKTSVEWTFESLDDEKTYVSIVSSGFHGDTSEVIAQATDSVKGFTFLLSGLKAFLEHGIQLNLTADAFPSKNVNANT